MRVSIRLTMVATFTCLCQFGWAQYPVEYPTSFPVIEGNVVSDGVLEGGIVTVGPEYPIQSSEVISGTTSSYASPVQYGAPMGGGSILDVVNSKRARAGLPALSFDAGLTQIAQSKSNIRANRGITGHDSSSRGHARVEGVGYAYGGNLTQRFNTCYLYSNGFSHAGAAIAYDRSGRAFYTLLLR